MVILKIESGAQDTSKHFFSIGFDRHFVKYFFNNEGNGTEIQSKMPHAGYSVVLNFREYNWGFSWGITILNRNFYVSYPESKDTHRLLGIKHTSRIVAFPIYLDYLLLNRGHWKIFMRSGLVYAILRDDIHLEYNYPAYPAYAEKERWDYYRKTIWSWSAGVNIERNLLKQDIYLSTKLAYTSELSGKPVLNTNSSNRLSFSLGLNIMVGNILYKDAMKTLKR